ncbi:MAG: amino acid ABC transporter permease [Chloroflexi bacterium]|nr:amino acid ABC transporter permease [Chloroflexota bacterium]MCI0578029.1 amino acid ABC transporter permease [Chloroflexota bacterium]MCI0644757.1 amino acid ABC transporter permease [Chloroflexota bacterium]MCI0728662.1 amino acid ABC transporter permease [Chloroflexota bacterium]
MSEALAFILRHLPHLLVGFPGQRPGGLLLSLILAAVGIGLGFVVAVAVGSARDSRRRPLRWLGRLYVEVFRGLPLVLLLLLVYQVVGGGRFGLDLSPRMAAVVALALYSGAYQTEILRAGLRTVPLQLVESARLMGSTPWQVFRLVKLRYAWRVMLPAFTGQAISLFKDTSVVIIIGVGELLTMARQALGSDVRYTPYWVTLYLVVGLLYFGVALGVSQLAQRWERRARSADLVHSLANY